MYVAQAADYSETKILQYSKLSEVYNKFPAITTTEITEFYEQHMCNNMLFNLHRDIQFKHSVYLWLKNDTITQLLHFKQFTCRLYTGVSNLKLTKKFPESGYEECKTATVGCN